MSNQKESHTPCIKRRDFLKAALTTFTLAGCSRQNQLLTQLPPISTNQRERRKQGKSAVAIVSNLTYQDDLFKAIKPYLSQIELPNFKEKSVLLKPNLVEFQPNKPIWTNAAVLRAAIELVDYMGA